MGATRESQVGLITNMAVLCEAISVIVRLDALEAPYGTFEAFKHDVPNDTLVADGEIVRVGFMTPDDVRAEPRRVWRRPFGLSYAAMAGSLSMV